jgi:hypothetical protein
VFSAISLLAHRLEGPDAKIKAKADG